jgi:hypothetical protein
MAKWMPNPSLLGFPVLPLNPDSHWKKKIPIFCFSLAQFTFSKGILRNPKGKQKIIIENSNSVESDFYTAESKLHNPNSEKLSLLSPQTLALK